MGNRDPDDPRENSIVPDVSIQSATAHLGSDPPASIRDEDTEASVLGSANGAEVSHTKLPPSCPVCLNPEHAGDRQLWSGGSAQKRGTSHLPRTARTSVSVSKGRSPRPRAGAARNFFWQRFQVSLPRPAVPVLQTDPPWSQGWFNPDDEIRAG